MGHIQDRGLQLHPLVDHAASPSSVNTLTSIHAIVLEILGKPGPDGTAGHGFFCIDLSAFLQRPGEEVGDRLTSSSIQSNCWAQSRSETEGVTGEGQLAVTPLFVLGAVRLHMKLGSCCHAQSGQ